MSRASILVAIEDEVTNETEIGKAVAYQMEPFRENEEWFEDGTRWDWWVIGGRFSGRLLGVDYMKIKEFNIEDYRQYKRNSYIESYHEAQKEKGKLDSKIFEIVTGVKQDETLDEFISRHEPFNISFYAFLKNRTWHEGRRLGWFGGDAATECELEEEKDTHICIHQKGDAKIVSWAGDNDWNEKYYDRFIKPLSENTTIVVVDYHV